MRTPILLIVLSFIITILPGCKKKKEIAGCRNPSSFNYNPSATVSDNSCLEMYGCTGYYSSYSNSGTLGTTFYNAFYDQKMSEEVTIQRSFFNGVPASVYVLYEPSPQHKNAYATYDGNIYFGYHMHFYTIQVYGELPVAGILAHEWGHRTQFTFGWTQNKTYQIELEADAFSGFYMALAKRYAWSQIQSYYANVYSSGDYNFNHPSHHGTPNQRLSAAYMGVTTAINAMQTNTQYTYQQLHNIFINQIKSNIAPRHTNETDFPEVVYPQMTPEQIKRLYPRQ